MSSRIWDRLDLNSAPKTVRDGFRDLARIEEATVQPMLEAASTFVISRNQGVINRRIDDLAEQMEVAPNVIARRLSALATLLNVYSDPKTRDDDPAAVVSDLVENDVLDPDDRDRVTDLLTRIKKVAGTEFEQRKRRRRATSSGETWLTGMELAPAYKPAFARDYDPEDSPNDHTPEFIGLGSAVSVVLRFADGNASPVSFSMSLERVDELVNRLLAIKRQFAAANEALGLEADE